MRHLFYLSAALALVTVWVVSLYWQPFLWAYVAVVPLVLLGVHDAFQTKRAVLRNFPVIGHGRYLLEATFSNFGIGANWNRPATYGIELGIKLGK